MSTTTSVAPTRGLGAPPAFTWDYEPGNERLARLYEKSKLSQWNASTDLDWNTPVDPRAKPKLSPILESLDVVPEGPVGEFLASSPENAGLMRLHDQSWLVSQFLHGEQGALLACGKIVAGAATLEDKLYAAAQTADEARHVEAYRRYLNEKVELTYAPNPYLATLLDQVVMHSEIDITYLGMQILVEGVALAAFGLAGALLANPLITRITELVRADEARHVAFGVLSLSGLYDDMDPVDLRVREDFLLEACALMRDRFVPTQVWEQLDLDVKSASAYWEHAPEQQAFRSMLFSKVVPNVRKLGLLTPRVRAGFETMGVLRFESYVDSATEAGELDADPDSFDERAPGSSNALSAFRAGLGPDTQLEPSAIFVALPGLVDAARFADVPEARIRITVTDAENGDWLLDIGRRGLDARPHAAGDVSDTQLRMSSSIWSDVIAGRTNPVERVLDGAIEVTGELEKALALEALL